MKKIFFAVFILILLVTFGIIYLNKVVLPTTIKAFIVNSLQEQTHKKISLQEVKFNIFKGLVLKNLVIYDDERAIASLPEGSCTFLILPIFKKAIIIPSISLKNPEIFIERRKDGTFDLQDLIPNNPASAAKPQFSVYVYKVNLTGGRIHFRDDATTPVFTKQIENLNLVMHLSLPSSIKFKLKGVVPAALPMNINALGEFKIPQKQLTARISIQDFSPKEFSAYYGNTGVVVAQGLLSASINIMLKDNLLKTSLEAQGKGLVIAKEGITMKLNSDLMADFQYGLADKQLSFSGKAKVIDSAASGLELVEKIDGINAEVSFDKSGISSDKVSASVWGIPLEAEVKLTDFNHPLISLGITSNFKLDAAQSILKDKFKFSLPGNIDGEANLSLGLETPLQNVGALQVKGYLDILKATLKLEKIDSPIEGINGRLGFSQNQLQWSDAHLEYLGIPYKTSGTVTNFQAPGVNLTLSSKDLSLESVFAVNNKQVNLSKLSGKYLNSGFSAAGDVDIASPADLKTAITGKISLDLRDAKEFLKQFKTQLEQANLNGIIEAQFSLNGNIKDIKSSAITAKLSSQSLSAYGFKSGELLMDYNQAAGLAEIPLLRLALYDGTLQANAKMNLNSENLPFWLTADVTGVKIEKMKLDTTAKDQDIAGIIQAQVKINGFSDDLSKLSGAGSIFITEGKLWQLNLFKGIGSLLFSKDFANIVFQEGSCGFLIRDRYIFTDNLKLKSNITNLAGTVKIGFDSSIDVALNVEVLDEMAKPSGTFKDIATAIIGQAGRFGVIKISGTLKEPKYKFQTAVVDIFKGIKNTIFGQ